MKRYVLLATLVAAVFLGACAKESKLPVATGKGAIRALNTIPTSPRFGFYIEEQFISEVEFKSVSSSRSYDDLDYVFNFAVLLAGDTAVTRVASQALNVKADKDYTFVISGAIAAPTVTIWEGDVREWTGTETSFDVTFGHNAATLVDDVDVYFTDVTTTPVDGLQVATLAYGEVAPPLDLGEGSYILTITAAGDDVTDVNNILFQSAPVRMDARSQYLVSLFDATANDPSSLAARAFDKISGGQFAMSDVRFPRTAQFYHAAINMGPVDIYVDDPLTSPLLSGHDFRDVSTPQLLPEGTLPITYTEAGMMGVLYIDVDGTLPAGVNSNLYAIEDSSGAYQLLSHLPDLRSIETQARISFMNTLVGKPSLDVYVVPAGELIDELSPLMPGLLAGFAPVQTAIAAGSYDIYVTEPGVKTALAGPISLDAALGDVLNFIIYENSDPIIVDVVSFPLP